MCNQTLRHYNVMLYTALCSEWTTTGTRDADPASTLGSRGAPGRVCAQLVLRGRGGRPKEVGGATKT